MLSPTGLACVAKVIKAEDTLKSKMRPTEKKAKKKNTPHLIGLNSST